MKGSSYGAAFLYVIMKVMEELLIQRSTCEIGLGERAGIPFIGIAYLLDACSK